ncbi:hypothetical protein GBA52_019598 [Prunus armeniaca]|nr:hypothetical protein GBA52_019598 [Prunus armeniaca]
MLLLSSSFEFEIDIERWVFALFVLLCSVFLLWVFNGIKRTVWFAAYGNVVRKVFDDSEEKQSYEPANDNNKSRFDFNWAKGVAAPAPAPSAPKKSVKGADAPSGSSDTGTTPDASAAMGLKHHGMIAVSMGVAAILAAVFL